MTTYTQQLMISDLIEVETGYYKYAKESDRESVFNEYLNKLQSEQLEVNEVYVNNENVFRLMVSKFYNSLSLIRLVDFHKLLCDGRYEY